MSILTAFAPKSAAGSTIAVTNASAVTAFNPNPSSLRVRLSNAGPADVFFEFGNSAVVAAVATGVRLPAGQTESFTCHAATHLAAITASGTATLYATPGEGI
jgi:YD repeat-containing protein